VLKSACTPVTGGQGPQGEQGPPGEDGAPGVNGSNGTNGQDGAQGPQGDSFIFGFFGYDGWSVETFDEYADGPISVTDQGLQWDGDGVVTGGEIVSLAGYGNGTTRKFLRLSGGSGLYRRKFGFGNSWQRLRIAVLWRINSVAATLANGGATRWGFGINSGLANGFEDSPINALTYHDKIYAIGPAAPLFTSIESGTIYHVFEAVNINGPGPTWSHGATQLALGYSGTAYGNVTAVEGEASLWTLDLNRPLGPFFNTSASHNTVNARTPRYDLPANAPNARQHIGKRTLVDMMIGNDSINMGQYATRILPTGNTAASGSQLSVNNPTVLPAETDGAGNINWDDSYGPFDSFEFFWKCTDADVDIAMIAVQRIL